MIRDEWKARRKEERRCGQASAHTKDGVIMGLLHRQMLIEVVQFHPESVLTKMIPVFERVEGVEAMAAGRLA